MIVVSKTLYDVLKLLSSLENHLPVRLPAKYIEFGNPLSLNCWPKGAKKVKHQAFIVFIVAFCVLDNLMAPAAAILILSSLQWIDLAPRMLGMFDSMNARDHPRNPNVAINCDATMVAAANLSCTEVSYTHILDQLFASVASLLGQTGATDIVSTYLSRRSNRYPLFSTLQTPMSIGSQCAKLGERSLLIPALC